MEKWIMRLWTTALSLVVAGAMAAGAFAQDGKGSGKKKGERPRISFADMDANKDGKLTKDEFLTAHLKNVPEDRKEKGKEYVGKMWEKLAGEKTELTEDEYKAAREKLAKEWKDKGGKNRGEKKGDK